MISRFAFMKPALTLFHLQNVLRLLDSHMFTIQMLPLLHLLEVFAAEVISDKIVREVAQLQRCRLLMNLGLKDTAEGVLSAIGG